MKKNLLKGIGKPQKVKPTDIDDLLAEIEDKTKNIDTTKTDDQNEENDSCDKN